MNLRVMAHSVDPDVDWCFVKVGPRKSARQPHVWLGCDALDPRIVLKFGGPGPIEEGARHKIVREIGFLSAVQRLPADDGLRDALPRMLAEGEVHGSRYVVTAYHEAPVASEWMPDRFGDDGRQLRDWLRSRLDWLRRLQSHEELRAALHIASDQVLCHGDFSHYNFLGGFDEAPLVIDWEDWHGARDGLGDALHVAFMPTVGSRPMEVALESFRQHWIRGSSWSDFVWNAVEGELGSLSPRDALAAYLDQQLERQPSGAEHVVDLFLRCREILRLHSA